MKWLLVGVTLLFGIRYILSSMNESDLLGDVALAPAHALATEVVAENVVEEVRRACRKRDCELDDASLAVNVGWSENVDTKVLGGGSGFAAKGPSQPIDIRFKCRRTGTFFIKKDLVVQINTRAPGTGGASHWPPEERAK